MSALESEADKRPACLWVHVLVPAIHVFSDERILRRGCPRPAAPKRSEASKSGHDGSVSVATDMSRCCDLHSAK